MTSIVTRMCTPKLLGRHSLLRPVQTFMQNRNMSVKPETEKANTAEANMHSQDLVNPLIHPDFFQVHDLFTIKDLFDAKVHLGHKEGTLNPAMKHYIFGSRLGHLIIDLDQTAEHLRAALNFTAHVAFRDGIILFISRNPQFTHLVDKTAKNCEEFSHTREWKVGLFPNSTHMYGTVTRLPELCIFINTLDSMLQQHIAVTHAAKMCIPTIGIVDTNCSPRLITYPVPGNDDTPSAIELYCKLFTQAIMRGKQAKKKLYNLE